MLHQETFMLGFIKQAEDSGLNFNEIENLYGMTVNFPETSRMIDKMAQEEIDIAPSVLEKIAAISKVHEQQKEILNAAKRSR